MQMPLVSIGMPVYNEAMFIRQSLDSLLAQSYSHFELIISDNASTDGTEQICREYAAMDKRVQYARLPQNQGAVNNFNGIFAQVRGQYFMLASGHDLWHSSYITRCLETLENDPDPVLCYTQTTYMDTQNNPLGIDRGLLDDRSRKNRYHAPVIRFNLVLWTLFGSNLIYGLIRTHALRKTQLFRPLIIGTDHILRSELSLLGAFAQVPEPLYYRRVVRNSEDEKTRIERHARSLFPQDNKQRIWFPYWRLLREYFSVITNAPCSLSAKMELVASVTLRFFWLFLRNPKRLSPVYTRNTER